MKKYLIAVLIPILLLFITGYYFISTAGSSYASAFFTGLGQHAQDDGRLGRASFYYQVALKLNSMDGEARIGLAEIREAKGEKASAEVLLQEGISLIPSKSSFYLALAALYTRDCRFEDGVRLLNQVTGAYTGLGIRNKRPDVPQVSPPGSSVTLPASFTITEQAGIDYYYRLTAGSSTTEWIKYREPVALLSGRQSFHVVGVSQEGIPSRITEFPYVCEEASAPAFSSLFTEEQLETIERYVEQKVKEELNGYTFVLPQN